jgi:GNAT superfamily N-acetyltransferase
MNPAAYEEATTLKNGQEVRIRAIRPADKDLVLAMFRKLEPESIYTRFFHAKKLLTDGDLKMITDVDFEKVVAFVVIVGPEDNETMIGGGRYSCIETEVACQNAEVAFTVKEDYHGQGIASMLLQRLAEIARARGVARFEAEVLPQNRSMLNVFKRSGLPVKEAYEGDSIHVVMPLTGGR